ncbi:hypothetical protein O1M63_32265 [Streptomyces mirabilis]|nr:hypothetical protein [Streptomyces mirabilis]
MLPTPFRDDSPHPAATISAAQTPRQPSLSPSPEASKADGSQAPVPGATTSAPTGAGSGGDEAQGPGAPSGQPDSSDAGRSARAREWWARTRSYCRDVLDGKTLESGRRRVLVDAAGGGRRVTKYCKDVLGRAGANTGDGRGDQGQGSDSGSDQGPGAVPATVRAAAPVAGTTAVTATAHRLRRYGEPPRPQRDPRPVAELGRRAAAVGPLSSR